MPTVQVVADGTATGNPQYLVFDKTEPWVGTIRDVIEDTDLDLDTTPIYLITTDHQLAEVHVESTDGEPDWLDWEVTLKEDGELIERVELEGGDGGWESATRTICVNGF